MLTESIPALRCLPRWLPLAILTVALSGCGTVYLAQAAKGEFQVLRARRSLDAVVIDPATPAPLRERLLRVREAREFAVAELHLPDNRSYRSYADIGRPYVVWNVVAAPQFSVEPKRWCFPIAGCVAYRGYFNANRARAFAADLAGKGFDVTVGGVPAYSTLGKFADPVLSSMMRYGDNELAAIIFHELAHQLVYVPNDSEFNEAFATTVENVGLERWLARQGKPESMQEFRAESATERAFIDLFVGARERLRGEYESGRAPAQLSARKAEIFAQLTSEVQALDRKLGVQDYQSWLKEGLNNAHLASIATYYACVPGLERLLAEAGGELPEFYDRIRVLAKMTRVERHARLCERATSALPPAS
jgi:predicted aminopeptidase